MQINDTTQGIGKEKINTYRNFKQIRKRKTPRRSEGLFVESYLRLNSKSETPSNIKKTSQTKPSTNEG
jgi:uncharacterized protein with NRDE domain